MTAKAKAIAAEVRLADANVKKKLLGYLETVMQGRPGEPALKFQQVRGIFEYFLVRLSPASAAATGVDELPVMAGSGSTIEETKIAMDALFRGDLQWPDVLVQTVALSPDTGFLWNALQWIQTFVMFENDVHWIVSCLDFLLKVEDGAERGGDSALEQCLLTVASVLTRRLLVFDWLISERKLVFQKLVDRVQTYFAKQDSDMEDVSLGSKSVDRSSSAVLRALAGSKVLVELSGGVMMSTYPEILRLALLVMAVGDVSKQGTKHSHSWMILIVQTFFYGYFQVN